MNETTLFERGINMHLPPQDSFDELLSSARPHCKNCNLPRRSCVRHVFLHHCTIVCNVCVLGEKNAISSVPSLSPILTKGNHPT